MAQWFIWQLQSDTLGLIPAVAGVSFFSFLPYQVEFHLDRIKIISLVSTEILAIYRGECAHAHQHLQLC